MLIKFSIENFLSFKDKQSLNMTADSLKEHKDFLHIPFQYDTSTELLKSAVIYGHNSSGKSNFLKAFQFVHTLVFESFSYASTNREIPLECFKLNTQTLTAKSHFEITFISDSIKYRYGFEILKNHILSEWLFYSEPKIRENHLFIRTGQDFKISKSWNKEISNKAEQGIIFAKPNVLFLSVLLQQDSVVHVESIGNWFRNNRVLFDFNDEGLFAEAALIISNPEYRRLINFFVKEAQLGFTTIEEKIDSHSQNKLNIDSGLLRLAYQREINKFEIYTKHEVFNDSIFYFGYVSNLSLNDLHNKLSNSSPENVNSDLTQQLHALAIGLANKFSKLRIAGILLIIEFILIAVLSILFITKH